MDMEWVFVTDSAAIFQAQPRHKLRSLAINLVADFCHENVRTIFAERTGHFWQILPAGWVKDHGFIIHLLLPMARID